MGETKTKLYYSRQEVEQMLRGDHPSQTKKLFGQIGSAPKKREIGEVWEELDADGNVKWVWEQRDGYRVKSSFGSDSMAEHPSWDKFKYPNCEATCQTQVTKKYSRLDEKYRKIYGMCSDCATKYESRLKTSGSWQAFEKAKMLANAQSFFNEADDAIAEAASRLSNVNFVRDESGAVEHWEGDPEKAKAMLEEYNAYKTLILETLEGKRDDVVI